MTGPDYWDDEDDEALREHMHPGRPVVAALVTALSVAVFIALCVLMVYALGHIV